MAIERVVSAVGHGENIQLAHTAYGAPVTKTQGRNGPGDMPGVAPAGLFSTAPYVDPDKVRAEKEAKAAKAAAKARCRAKNGTCRGFAERESGLCLGHRRKLEREGHLDDLAPVHGG